MVYKAKFGKALSRYGLVSALVAFLAIMTSLLVFESTELVRPLMYFCVFAGIVSIVGAFLSMREGAKLIDTERRISESDTKSLLNAVSSRIANDKFFAIGSITFIVSFMALFLFALVDPLKSFATYPRISSGIGILIAMFGFIRVMFK